jgi:hypothetical protein
MHSPLRNMLPRCNRCSRQATLSHTLQATERKPLREGGRSEGEAARWVRSPEIPGIVRVPLLYSFTTALNISHSPGAPTTRLPLFPLRWSSGIGLAYAKQTDVYWTDAGKHRTCRRHSKVSQDCFLLHSVQTEET